MFGDPVINPMGWDKKTLVEVSNKITDGTHQSPKFISEEEYNQLIKHTPIEVGDILYTSVGSYGNL